jgi:hypothetical protein
MTLRGGQAGVAGELLDIAQAAAALDDLARRLGDEPIIGRLTRELETRRLNAVEA